MCLVIDTCCIAKVFDPKNEEHADYAPVFDWINSGTGRMIYGGTKYGAELRHAGRYLRIIGELNRRGRAIKIHDVLVDGIAANVKASVIDPRLNDEHIIALVIASKCCVVCTYDKDAIFFLKQPRVFSHRRVKRPKIYSSRGNKDLCCALNTAESYGKTTQLMSA